MAHDVTFVSPSQIYSDILDSKGGIMCCTEKGESSSNPPKYGPQDVRSIDWGSDSADRPPYRPHNYPVSMHHVQCPSCAVVGVDTQDIKGFQCSKCSGSLVMDEKATIHNCESLKKAFTVWYNLEYNSIGKRDSIYKGHTSQLSRLISSGKMHPRYVDPFAKPGIITDEVMAKFQEVKVHSMKHDMQLPIKDIRMALADTPGYHRGPSYVHPSVPTTTPNYTSLGPGKYIPPHLRKNGK